MSCDIAYCCELCDFHLDIARVYLRLTVKYDGHVHLLTVVENIHLERTCDTCDSPCPAGSSTLRCWECNFNLHIMCGPLPCTIKHKCHIDQLTLKDFYAGYNDDDDDDDDDEFYCDACEQRSDPRLCVHYCALGCPMVVDVKCVISEVIASVRGERGRCGIETCE
ncbi:uncharacterized protein LOC105632299 [Jatropha curcas]|uniref:uncharacterized protein LOC105632299 n=1 Tax=Jatropha curcas TaxID=180498 RepID=UPI0005FC2144|nr:uncharacterized protein LOC105632299 [Jatropha curcas]